MHNLSPVWIVCTLSTESHQVFEDKINRQFEAFSLNEFGNNYNSVNNRWWKVININNQNISSFVDNIGHPKDLPAVTDTNGTFDLTKSIVIFIGNIDSDLSFNKSFDYIEQLKTINFLPGVTDIFYYGICIFKNNQKKDISERIKKIEKLQNEKISFDAILFQSDINKNTTNNSLGYDNLDGINKEENSFVGIFDHTVQTIFHIALTRSRLRQTAFTQKKVFLTGGAYNITFEPDAYKQQIANEIAIFMFDRFCNEKENKAWCNESEALNQFNKSEISSKYSWKSIFDYLTQNFKEEENIASSYPKPPISPWSLFSHWLIPKYFKKYLRNLAVNIREGAHFFGYKTSDRYLEHYNKQFAELLKEDSDYAAEKISILLKNVWANNNELDKPGGMQHIRIVLDKINSFITEQLKFIIAIKDEKAPKNSNFPLISDYPLKNIPKQFYSYYRDFILNGESEAENPEEKNKQYEERKLTELVKILKFHPVPLSLFIRAVLLGIMAPLVIWVLLLIIPNFGFDTSFLEKGNGLLCLYWGIFMLFLLGALYKYWVKILRKIRNILREYLAWYLFKIQKKLFKDVLENQEKYYMTLLDECNRIKINIEGFKHEEENKKDNSKSESLQFDGFLHDVFQNKCEVDKRMEFIKPLLPVPFTKFDQTMFQRDILGTFDGVHKILRNDVIIVKIIVNKSEYEQHNFSDDSLLALFFNDLLKENSKLLELLNEKILKYKFSIENLNEDEKDKKNERIKEYWDGIRKALCKMLSDSILSRIRLMNGANIEDLVFSNTLKNIKHNFNIINQNRDIPSLIKSRFYPSVMLSELNPHQETSYVIPKNALYDKDKWTSVFSNELCLNTLYRKSIVSIFQTFSLNSSGDIDFS